MTCNPEHLEQLRVLCMVAFFGYSILLDLVVIRVLIRQEGCTAVEGNVKKIRARLEDKIFS